MKRRLSSIVEQQSATELDLICSNKLKTALLLQKLSAGKFFKIDLGWLFTFILYSEVFSGKFSLKKCYFDSVPLLGNNTKLVKFRHSSAFIVGKITTCGSHVYDRPEFRQIFQLNPEQSGDAESWPTATRSSRRGRIPFVFLGLNFSTLSSPSRSLGWRGLRKSWRKPREPPSTTEIRHSGRFMNFAHGCDQ